MHSKRINSGDSNKHRVTENNHHKQNDHHTKTLNDKTPSIPDKSIIVENIHTIPDTTYEPVENHTDDSKKETTVPGITNK